MIENLFEFPHSINLQNVHCHSPKVNFPSLQSISDFQYLRVSSVSKKAHDRNRYETPENSLMCWSNSRHCLLIYIFFSREINDRFKPIAWWLNSSKQVPNSATQTSKAFRLHLKPILNLKSLYLQLSQRELVNPQYFIQIDNLNSL